MCGKTFSRSDHLGLHVLKHKELRIYGTETMAGIAATQAVEPTTAVMDSPDVALPTSPDSQ